MRSPEREEGLQHRADGGHGVARHSSDESIAAPQGVWDVEPGPFGRGECLVMYDAENDLRLLAPPGVPLAPPEPVRSLLRWRSARWAHGRLVGSPRPLSLGDALESAPSKRAWIVARAREREDRDQSAGYTISENVDETIARSADEATRTPLVEPAHHRPLLTLTRSASTFSTHIASMDRATVVKRIELMADSERRLKVLRARLAELEREVGAEGLREAVIALLHARARSHSWRYTRIMGLIPVKAGLPPLKDPLTRRIEREIDRAPTGKDLERTLSRLAAEHPGVEQQLVVILHERSRSLRWTLTRPARRLLARSSLRRIRNFLRELQPRIRGAPGIRRVLHTDYD